MASCEEAESAVASFEEVESAVTSCEEAESAHVLMLVWVESAPEMVTTLLKVVPHSSLHQTPPDLTAPRLENKTYQDVAN